MLSLTLTHLTCGTFLLQSHSITANESHEQAHITTHTHTPAHIQLKAIMKMLIHALLLSSILLMAESRHCTDSANCTSAAHRFGIHAFSLLCAEELYEMTDE